MGAFGKIFLNFFELLIKGKAFLEGKVERLRF